MQVLLIDDNEALRISLAVVLEDAGMDVISAPDAETALEMMARECPEVVVSDINLGPGLDGIALAEHLRCRCPSIRVIMITGLEASLEGRSLDPRDRLLFKPFLPSDLTRSVYGLSRQEETLA